MCHKGFIYGDLVSGHKGIYVLMDGIGIPCEMMCQGFFSDFGGGFFILDGVFWGCHIHLLCECLGYLGKRGGVKRRFFFLVCKFGKKKYFEWIRGNVLVGRKEVFVFLWIF